MHSSDSNSTFIQNQTERRFMLFDLAVGGHHPSYIRHLVCHWYKEKKVGRLFVVVSPDFFCKHSDVSDLGSSSVSFVKISAEESDGLDELTKPIQRAFFEWKIYCKYAESLSISHSLLMYFDHLQLPIALGQSSPCPFSGIYFRPTIHYKTFDTYSGDFKDAWRRWRQRTLLSLVLKNQNMRSLLTLDKYAVPHIERISSTTNVIRHLPDPISVKKVNSKDLEALRARLGIEENRKIFLSFGRLSKRKGIFQTLSAFADLPPEIAKECCLLMVGEPSKDVREQAMEQVLVLNENSLVQAFMLDGYQKQEDIPLYFSLSDYVLAPYQKHIGMSGVLLLAAAYKRPLIASEYGLLGKLTKDLSLGITLKTSSSSDIRDAIIDAVCNSSKDCFKYKDSKFSIDEYSADKFSSLIFRSLIAESTGEI